MSKPLLNPFCQSAAIWHRRLSGLSWDCNRSSSCSHFVVSSATQLVNVTSTNDLSVHSSSPDEFYRIIFPHLRQSIMQLQFQLLGHHRHFSVHPHFSTSRYRIQWSFVQVQVRPIAINVVLWVGGQRRTLGGCLWRLVLCTFSRRAFHPGLSYFIPFQQRECRRRFVQMWQQRGDNNVAPFKSYCCNNGAIILLFPQ